MAKVICVDSTCIFHGKNNVCTAKNINLSWASVLTVNDGRREFNTCQTKEQNPLTDREEKFIDDFLKGVLK